MSVSPFDSALYRDLFGDAGIARLFSDGAEVRAMMLVLGALAKAQGAQGAIPETSGRFLHRAMMEAQVDPAGLAQATGGNGVTVPGLVAALRKTLDAPEHAHYLHWGATSQDIQDSALMLRLSRALALIEARMAAALAALADRAEAHATTPQAARTYGQLATPSSFGALAASWGAPLLRMLDRLEEMRPRCLCVSLSGAAGTASMLGPDPAALRAALAADLGLGDPGGSWHASRDRIGEIGGWLADLASACGKAGGDMTLLARSEIAEIALPGAGASSTMPQKRNPVAPAVMVALARFAPAQASVLQGAAVHAEARDGAAWFAEWLALPPLVAAAARAVAILGDLAAGLEVRTDAMEARAADPLGLVHAEALSFALASVMKRPEAQALVKSLALEARETGAALPDLVARARPDARLPDLSPPASLGTAPAEALAFAAAARTRASAVARD
ncbi:lyase family protein [Roseibacterium sp. SDUM158017]|uniref:lyase family protein n=1 Tax=Roseicyclus salinarum TaxID=3036773 RepID=UPI002415508E|nr:lyase family protein [Roseibacterium sp. SDUM158017]MDG4649974.1 lyase family protein [Roseibacterium sp. SDUM158017]